MDQVQAASLLLRGGPVVTMDPSRRVFMDGAVVVDQSTIRAVGDRQEIERSYQAAKTIDTAGAVVLPGLINAHTHSFQTLWRGLGDDIEVLEWVRRVIYPLSRHAGAKEAFVGGQLACLEMIKGGVSCFNDSFYIHQEGDALGRLADAVEESGMRAVIARACSDTGDRPDEFKEATEVAVSETESAIRSYNGRANGRIRVCPEALYTLFASPELIAGLRELASRHGTRFHMHAGESIHEANKIRRETGKTIFSYLDSIDALGEDVLIFHAVWCADSDIEILAQRGTAISHNPVSNQYLAAGVAPVSRLIERGVTVGLGSDGAASNNTQDLFESMKAAVLLQKAVLLNPKALTAEMALEMATIDGARAVGLSSEIGSLEVGKKADLTVVNLRTPHSAPALKPVSNLVYTCRAADVRTLVVDGEVIMEDRKVLTMDESEVIAHAQEIARRMVSRSETDHLLETGRFAYLPETRPPSV
jgi:5-methylthioadenosine/S-adenosylhomocysteine deaminase